ncbi:MAG: type II secretion system protein [bacterium]|nr:type II secretion system protein [bacterium]
MKNQRGFNLIKLLIVVGGLAIIAIIGSLISPIKSREAANLSSETVATAVHTTVTNAVDSAETVGNNTYIIIWQHGMPHNQRQLILETMRAFEESHPGLEVLDWRVETKQADYTNRKFIYGLWVHHRPQ